MSIDYYNGIDEIIRTEPKNHEIFLDATEKYAKINSGSDIDNPDYDTGSELTNLINKKLIEIDIRTGELISEGFVYGANTFSLSSVAQKNWISLKVMKEAGSITYPLGVSTITNGEYLIADSTIHDVFTIAAFDATKGHVDSGRALKLSAQAAADLAALKLVVDTR